MIPLRDTQPSYSTPFVTILVIVMNVFVFLYEVSLDDYSRNAFISTWGMIPARFEYTDMLTSMFLHGGWLHLIGNMWFLWIYGDNVEDTLGHGKFLLFYLLCGLAAAGTQAVTNLDSRIPTVGASGAIAGVMGAYLVKFPHSRILTLVVVFVFITTVEIPAVLILAYWFLIQLASGMWSVGYSQLSQGGVAWFAHVGGFVAGIVLINVMRTRERYRRRRDLHW
ncbi:MAG: rhomboid family intramembrane serine protease [Bryobacteraceae bacterium]|nr:rhomboid family intramembrane serine protease [Bryobacterales bacterium]MEB2361066.1 rhomboid family intramembrane serine protease [Bryobacterales bacterium]NUN02960.1 rhomboid family intramembrane serine protease [Bryobacteraceae bacterium]